eukprot:gnl/TRDRNA2_/TRDRNA2_80236_c0_seq2.p1 gnl/TRDRNA2_/TRDRNA2_80236_c0~~gnl/TRDRNA2_/TRDRNA2_80236_c0_seq2.p1  ORF type:complete len:586 (+),score=94.01 gnl/TRDRNA2_/TRDRNA2_80236_c0_seq2:157-1758(+)
MGFAPDVARIALHVAGGDEKRALEICMSGLAFCGSPKGGTAFEGAHTPVRPPEASSCYICGARHVSEKSLEFHLKACRKRFEQRQSKLPPGQRRRLLDESELPPGVECLEKYYEQLASEEREAALGPFGASTRRTADFDDWIARQKKQELVPCEFCCRTFTAERIETHRRCCLQRPKQEPQPVPKIRNNAASLSGPPAAAVRAYDAFCQQLAQCPRCSRQFRPDVLKGHVKQCCPELARDGRASKAAGPPRWPATPGGGRSSSRASLASPSPVLSRRSSSLSASPAKPSTSTTQAKLLGSATPTRPLGKISFTPPARHVPATSTPGAASPQPPPVEESMQSIAALISAGLVTVSSEEEMMLLRAQFAERLPAAEVVGAYIVHPGTQSSMYEAKRSTMQDLLGADQALSECELWHGTLWATLPKILRQGFNRSFAGRHGTLLGIATYFATDLGYSHRFCDRRGGGKDGTKVMLLSRVLVGRYCKGDPSDVEPPVLDLATGEQYDSTVDNVEQPSIFAVFRDFQALPLMLVEFRS